MPQCRQAVNECCTNTRHQLYLCVSNKPRARNEDHIFFTWHENENSLSSSFQFTPYHHGTVWNSKTSSVSLFHSTPQWLWARWRNLPGYMNMMTSYRCDAAWPANFNHWQGNTSGSKSLWIRARCNLVVEFCHCSHCHCLLCVGETQRMPDRTGHNKQIWTILPQIRAGFT